MKTICTALVLGLISVGPLAAQENHLELLHQKTRTELERIAAEVQGVVGYRIIDLSGGPGFALRADWVFPQGSAIKIPVLMEVYRQAAEGLLDRNEAIRITRERQVGGSGVIQALGDGGSSLSIGDLGVLMILVSDNSATNILIEKVGMEKVNAMLDAEGFRRTRLRRLMMDSAARGRGDENVSTPEEAAGILLRLQKGLFVDRGVSDEILGVLRKYKPGVIRSGLTEDVPVAFKPGGIPGVSTEWALVELPERPYIIVVMGNYGVGGEFRGLFRRISRVSFEYFRRLGRATRYGTYVDPKLIK